MSTALLLASHLDPALRPRLERAAELARLALRTWEPRAADQTRPDLILGGLVPGCRTLPDELVRLADETYPGTPVLLVSAETLVQPVVMLQGGRLCLLGPPHAVEAIVTQLGVALSWREREAETRRITAPPSPAPLQERVVRREDHRHEHSWASFIAPVEAGNAHVELNLDQGFTAVLAPASERQRPLTRDLLPTLDAWQDQPDSDQLRRALAERSGAWAAMAHLDAAGQRWLLISTAQRWPLVLGSPQRLPAWWSFSGDDDDHHLHVIDAEPDDVVLIAAPLPDDPAFAPGALAAAASNGGEALASHLVEHARRLDTPIAAVVLERRA